MLKGGSMRNNILILNLKSEYFDSIINGDKVEEYREVKPFWEKRLFGRDYKYIEIRKGYPRATDTSRVAVFEYLGYEKKIITHKIFGNKETEVFALKIGKRVR